MNVRSVAAMALTALAVSGCGAGGGDALGGLSGPGSGSPGTGPWGLSSIALSLGTTSVSLTGSPSPATVPMSWAARRENGNPVYYVQANLVAAGTGATAALTDGNRVFHRNCGMPGNDCDLTGSYTCTYRRINDNPMLDCGEVHRRRVDPGVYDFVLRACFINEQLAEVCRGEGGAGRKVFPNVTFN